MRLCLSDETLYKGLMSLILTIVSKSAKNDGAVDSFREQGGQTDIRDRIPAEQSRVK